MIGGIISRLTGAGRARPTARRPRPAPGRRPVGGAGASPEREIERGARTLFRGLRRRR